MKIDFLKHLILLILTFTQLGIFAQNKPEMPKMSIQFDIGIGKNGTGDMNGFQINTELKKYFRKKMSFAVGIGATIHDGFRSNIYTNTRGERVDGSLRYNSDGLQATTKLGLSFIRNQKSDLGMQIGSIFRYQSSSYPDEVGIYYPSLTGFPFTVIDIIHLDPQRIFAIGGIIQPYYNYALNEKIYIGANAAFQIDTNGDAISQLNLTCGMKF